MEALTGVQKYLNIIAQYEIEFKKWEARTQKIVKRYRDDNRNQNTNETAKFNILWSNVQTLIPAVYARLPKAAVSRRFGDNDPVGRVASQLIERSLDFEIEHYSDFRSAMRHAVEDRFLGGRGVAWVRYEPHVVAQDMPDDGYQITEDVDKETGIGAGNEGNVSTLDGSAGMDAEPQEEIEYECAPTDYVHWKDFGHSIARTWEEVTQVWRWVYMTREALIERFGEEVGNKIPLDAGPETNKQYGQNNRDFTRAKICELWDLETEKVYWLSKNVGQIIDERDDPLGLEGFFPCAKPLYATMTSDTLIPVADFVLYQDQAQELDILTDRIDGLVKALRIRGVYDASQPALQRLLTEGDNNTLIPVDKWMGFSEKGGLKGSIDILPIDQIAGALIQCYRARDEIKGQIYEITGISDIVRGQTSASETATAQQIKGQYAGLRLRSMQEDVALFASELIRLKAQIICSKFQPQTIVQYAAAEQMSDADKQLVPQALMLIKDKVLRNFRIEVAADSLVQIDENQNKRDRVEFLQAMGGFLSQALPMGQQAPELVPMLVDMVKFGMSAYKQAEPIEGTIDQALEQMKQKQQMAAQQPPQPDPEVVKMQLDQQREQARTDADIQIEQIKAQSDSVLEKQKQDFEAWKVQFEAQNKINLARIAANPGYDIPLIEQQESAIVSISQSMKDAITQMAQLNQQMMALQAQTIQQIEGVKTMVSAPKRVIRGIDGKVAGVEVVQ